MGGNNEQHIFWLRQIQVFHNMFFHFCHKNKIRAFKHFQIFQFSNTNKHEATKSKFQQCSNIFGILLKFQLCKNVQNDENHILQAKQKNNKLKNKMFALVFGLTGFFFVEMGAVCRTCCGESDGSGRGGQIGKKSRREHQQKSNRSDCGQAMAVLGGDDCNQQSKLWRIRWK
jgi:hypothetical protein